MLKLCAVFIFLSLISCTGGSADKSAGPVNANAGRPSGGTEGIPGYILAPSKIKAHYSADRLIVEAPQEVLVAKDIQMEDLRLTVVTATTASLSLAASSPIGSSVSIAGAESLGVVVPGKDGSFRGDFARPNISKEAVAILVGSASSQGKLIVPKNSNTSTAVYQLVSESNGEVEFYSVFSEEGPKVLSSLSATSASQSAEAGLSWLNVNGALSEAGTRATNSIYDGNTTNGLLLTGFFSQPAQALPPEAILNGFVVNCSWRANSATEFIKLKTLRLMKGGVEIGNNKGGGFPLTHTLSLSGDYGSSTDLWGTDQWGTTLTGADVNSPDFGIKIQFEDTSDSAATIEVDYCKMEVFYGTPIQDTTRISTFPTSIAAGGSGYAGIWTNINNAQSRDNLLASVGPHLQTNPLILSGYFSTPATRVPANATINGIEVNCLWLVQEPSTAGFRLMKNGAIYGAIKTADTLYYLPSLKYSPIVGGRNDLWGGQWTPEEINSPSFGLSLSFTYQGGSPAGWLIAQVDFCQMKVYFSPE